jgi:D-alanine-D-alanine ligase
MARERVGVVFGGPSPEHDISILTGLQATRALLESGWDPVALYWSKDGMFHRVSERAEAQAFASGVPEGATLLELVVGRAGGFVERRGGLRPKSEVLPINVVVNCCHGGPGEDGSLQGLLDLAGVRYTGPSARSAALGMDKLAFSALMRAHGLPTLPRVDARAVSFDGPYIVKPRFGGSSIGIEVIEDREQLDRRLQRSEHFRDGAVVEPYRRDLVDLQLALRSYPSLTLSAIERPLRGAVAEPILSYRDKYQPLGGMATAPRELPARISEELAARLREHAVRVAELVGVRGVLRVDFLCSLEGECYVNEVNTIPGSLSHYLFIEPRISFADQLALDIHEALERPTYRPVVAGADGSVLRSASSIAAKLA